MGPIIGRNLSIYQRVGGKFPMVSSRPTGDRGNWHAADLYIDRGAAVWLGMTAYRRSSSLGRYSRSPGLAHSRVRQIERWIAIKHVLVDYSSIRICISVAFMHW